MNETRGRYRMPIDWDTVDWTSYNDELAAELGCSEALVKYHRTLAIVSGMAPAHLPKRTRTGPEVEQCRHRSADGRGWYAGSVARARAAARAVATIPPTCEECGRPMRRHVATRYRAQWVCPACLLGEDLCSREQLEECAREATRRTEGVVW
jgi:hypothetical protein